MLNFLYISLHFSLNHHLNKAYYSHECILLSKCMIAYWNLHTIYPPSTSTICIIKPTSTWGIHIILFPTIWDPLTFALLSLEPLASLVLPLRPIDASLLTHSPSLETSIQFALPPIEPSTSLDLKFLLPIHPYQDLHPHLKTTISSTKFIVPIFLVEGASRATQLDVWLPRGQCVPCPH